MVFSLSLMRTFILFALKRNNLSFHSLLCATLLPLNMLFSLLVGWIFFLFSRRRVENTCVFFVIPHTHTSNSQKGKLLCSETIFKWSARHQPFFCYCFHFFFISLSPFSSVPFFLVRNVSVTQQHLLPFRWVFFVFQFAWWWFQLCQSICPQRKTYTHSHLPQEIKKFVPLFFPLKGK